MKKEKYKTLLLILLVCISIFLTRKVWMKIPYEIFPVFREKEVSNNSYIISDMIVPNKYLLNFNQGNHTLYYSDEKHNLWVSTKEILKEVLSTKNYRAESINNEQFMAYQNVKSINFIFPEKVNTYILNKSLEIKNPNDIYNTLPEIDSIYIYLEKDKPFLIFSNSQVHIKISDPNIETRGLREVLNGIEEKGDYTYYYSMRDTLGSMNDIYIPYEMTSSLPIVYVDNEININNKKEITQIAEKFFDRDIDYLREIVENNGSTIYIYNQKVLKIYQNGLLEFFSPIEQPVLERNLYISLNTAGSFISNYIGAPKGMYLDKIEEIKSDSNLGYRFTFKYRIRGIPVILGDDEIQDFIQIEVFNNYVKSYRRFIRKDVNALEYKTSKDKQMLSAFEILDLNYELIENNFIEDNVIDNKDVDLEKLRGDIEASIQDISMAYYDPCQKQVGEKLVGAWVITVDKRIYVFDIYGGKLVYEKKKI